VTKRRDERGNLGNGGIQWMTVVGWWRRQGLRNDREREMGKGERRTRD